MIEKSIKPPYTEFVLDCFGDQCPLPILKLEKVLHKLESREYDQIKLLTEHSCVPESLNAYLATKNGGRFKTQVIEAIDGVWEVYVRLRI